MKSPYASRTLLAVLAAAMAGLCATLPAWAAEERPASEASEPSTTGTDGALEATGPTDASESSDADRSGGAMSAGGIGPSSADGGTTARSAKRRKFGERALREGMRGGDVRRLQKVLTKLNFRTGVDGSFGRATRRNVRRYEHWKERKVNGVVHMGQAQRMKELVRSGARYRAHVFPVRGPHDYGGEGSRFGAPRSGHTHQGQDVAAAEGTRLVAAHEGRVHTRQYQAGGAGHYIVIRGRDRSDSVYMHLQKPARVRPSRKVMAGETIGKVGTTGSSTGPHLHFELWTRHWYDGGSAYDPLRKLRKWDRRT